MEIGLTTKEVFAKQKEFGKNEITAKESFSVLKLFLMQFPTLINGILAIGAIFSFFIQEALDGILIFVILILNSLFGFFQEYRAEKALQKLKQLSQPISVVMRDGQAVEIQSRDIVPGDIAILNEGDRIPADGEIITSSHLEVDESVLTGESLPVIKNQKDRSFQGTYVARGKGKLLVTNIGDKTKFGQIAKTLANVEDEQTPLQKQIVGLAKILSFAAIVLSVLLFPIGLLHGKAIYPLLILVISISVAAIPESLPAVITIALSLGTNRMTKKKAIVRRLASIETVGAVQVVLTDKTGTLTQNEMRVKDFFVKEKSLMGNLLEACIVGNTAHIVKKDGKEEIIGDKTDGAFLLWASEQKRNIKESSIEVLDEYTFDPQTKTITTIAKASGKPFVFVRGAPESVLSISKLLEKDKKTLTQKYEDFAAMGLRVIAFAQKHEPNHKGKSRKELESNMTFLGFVCIYDPPRKEARESVLSAQAAGVRVVMVTGDNPLTAKAIATEVGILDGNKSVLTGTDVDKMKEEELLEAIKDVSVFARVNPQHKMRLVIAFQKLGLVVGVTGDGVNDALALKKADVGLSMGQKGTDVAREASDIVLADDNFATLVDAIKEGRKIYANIVKAIVYLISGNLAELGLIFFSTIFNSSIPLIPTQILWINLITDGMPALALASESDEGVEMRNKPRKKQEPILTRKRLIFILVTAMTLTTSLFFVFTKLDHDIGIDKARTVVFNLMIFMQIFLAFIVRGKKSLFSNKLLVLTSVLTIILQVMLTTIPALQTFFRLSL